MPGRSVFLLAFLVVLSAPTGAQELSLRLNNQSGKRVETLLLMPKGIEGATEINALAGSGLEAEQMRDIPIASLNGQCVFDLKVTFADSTELLRNEMDLCQTAELIIE